MLSVLIVEGGVLLTVRSVEAVVPAVSTEVGTTGEGAGDDGVSADVGAEDPAPPQETSTAVVAVPRRRRTGRVRMRAMMDPMASRGAAPGT